MYSPPKCIFTSWAGKDTVYSPPEQVNIHFGTIYRINQTPDVLISAYTVLSSWWCNEWQSFMNSREENRHKKYTSNFIKSPTKNYMYTLLLLTWDWGNGCTLAWLGDAWCYTLHNICASGSEVWQKLGKLGNNRIYCNLEELTWSGSDCHWNEWAFIPKKAWSWKIG